MTTAAEIEARVVELEREALRKGLIIEAGFFGFRKMAIAPDASAEQVIDMRLAFFAGAQHLYATMMRVMDSGDDVTDRDLENMKKIADELDRFAARELNPRAFGPAQGKG